MPSVPEQLKPELEGRYTIERELGQGGMATVYLAQDVRHRRQVAVKVLHPELSAVIGPERFLKEIELTAQLQHPHILPLFDSGSAGGLLYYVMPFVEGETLRARLDRERQLPVADAVRIATEVASALEYAHARGVVHRDIKPENILLQSGSALVADFGIALAVRSAGGERMTQTGLSLGTPQYMAPEQATGEKAVDLRADLYALGAVTYEMLAGQPPFTGPNMQSIIAKVITEDAPAIADFRRSVPAGVAVAVHRALEKLPADRPSSAREFAEAMRSAETGVMPTTRRPAARGSRALLVAGWCVAAVGIGVAAWQWRAARDVPTLPPTKLSMSLIGGAASTHRAIDISADGRRVVYAVSSTATPGIYVHDLDSDAPQFVRGSGNAYQVYLAPDGHAVYFSDGARTWRSTLNGEAPQIVEAVPASSRFYAFDSKGGLYFSSDIGELYRLGEDGKAKRLFEADSAPQRAVFQQILPGDRYALMKESQANDGLPFVFDLERGTRTRLFDFSVANIRYAAGHLLYVRNDGRLNAAPFDLSTRKVTGASVALAEDIGLSGNGIAQFGVAANGTVVYLPSSARDLVYVTRAGVATKVGGEQRNFHDPEISPDGKQILVDFTLESRRDVWLIDRATGTTTRVTSDQDGHDASWTPDGRSFLYASQQRTGRYGIYRTRPGSGTVDSLVTDPRIIQWPGRFFPDGKRILTLATDLNGRSGIDVAMIDSAGKIQTLEASPGNDSWADLSPDGSWLAWTSNHSGESQVYARALAGGDRVQVSLKGGTEPRWSKDGKELFYRATGEGAHQVLTSTILRRDAQPSVRSRTPLFSVDEYVSTQPHSNYAPTPDAKGFIMVRSGLISRAVVLQNLAGLVERARGGAASAPR